MCDAAGQPAQTKEAAARWNARERPLTDAEVESIAAFVHEANRRWQGINGEEPSPPWEDAPEWQRESARKGVRFALEEARKPSPRFLEKSGAEQQHDAWLEEKLRAGWTYGPVKDASAKTHPCLLPYKSLPPWQRRKDIIFGALCDALDPRREV